MAPKKAAATHYCFSCNSPATQQDLGDKNYYCNACFEKWEASQGVAKKPAGKKAAAPVPAPVPAATSVQRPRCVVCDKAAKRDPHTDGKYYCGPHLQEALAAPPVPARGKKAPAAPAPVPVAPKPSGGKKSVAAPAATNIPAYFVSQRSGVAADRQPVKAPAAPAVAAEKVRCVVCHRVAANVNTDRGSTFCDTCFEGTQALRAPGRQRRPAPPAVDPSADRVRALEDQIARLHQEVKTVRGAAQQQQGRPAQQQQQQQQGRPAQQQQRPQTAAPQAAQQRPQQRPQTAPSADPARRPARAPQAAPAAPAAAPVSNGSPARKRNANQTTLPEVRW